MVVKMEILLLCNFRFPDIVLYYCILGLSKLKSTNVRIQIRSCSYFSMLLFSLPCFASLCWNVIYVSSINNLIMIGLTCPVVLFLEIVLVYYFGPSMIHSHILYLKVSVNVLQESTKTATQFGKVSSLERLLALVIPHIVQKPDTCQILIHNGVLHPRFLQFLSYGSSSHT